MKASNVYEEISLRTLREKARQILSHPWDQGTREILIENLVEQAYHTGGRDTTFTVIEDMIEQIKGGKRSGNDNSNRTT